MPVHQVTITMSERGIPVTYRHMNGYGSNAFSLISSDNKRYWVKFHFKIRLLSLGKIVETLVC